MSHTLRDVFKFTKLPESFYSKWVFPYLRIYFRTFATVVAYPHRSYA